MTYFPPKAGEPESFNMCDQAHNHSHSHGRFSDLSIGRFRPVGRRTFLAGLGQGMFALLTEASSARNVITIALGTTGLAACAAPPARQTSSPTAASSTTAMAATVAPAAGGAALSYNQVNLGFVNAYVLVRGNEVAVVDTGVANSQGKIEEVIKSVGRAWSDVKHVILTHYHPDHAGSLDAVMTASTNAKAYAHAEDIPQIKTSAKLMAVADGSDVFGLQIIGTPGHTPGHISVFDPVGSTFIVGDALNNNQGKLEGPNPQYSSDMVSAIQSAKKIATLKFETAYFMHGSTIESGASAAIAKLAETLK
jgi:glyoxylase-like metal-dependent hydrolase (beta-lactamase superfamily II)